jgi:F-type H+-transporting ATPase subunit b
LTFDLFTFIAQIVNFIILVLLLRHFLYKRIVRVMDEREKNIASRIEEAKTKKKEAEEEAKSFQKKRQELEEKETGLISQAEREAEDRRKELIQEAREDVDRTQKRWQESLQRQKEMFLHDLRRCVGEQVFEMARRALKDLADEELEKHILETFLHRLQDLGEKKKEEIKKSLEQSSQEAVVLSRFKIPETLHQKAEKYVKEIGGRDTRVKFKTSEDLIGGIELEVGDRKIAWGIDSYLSDLEETVSEAVAQRISDREPEKEGKEKGSGKK